MCGANKRFFLYLLLALLLTSAAGVLRAGEPDMPVYLISEAELLSIEQYRNSREAERQSWLSWVSALKLESGSLNSQLVKQREANRTLTESFNRYEQDLLTLISMKNGEIADLKQTAADRTLEAAAYKGIALNRLIIIIVLAGSWIVFIVFKACRFFRLF